MRRYVTLIAQCNALAAAGSASGSLLPADRLARAWRVQDSDWCSETGGCLLMIFCPSREAQSLEVHLPVASVSIRVTANKSEAGRNNGVTVVLSLCTGQTLAVLNSEARCHMRARL